MAKTAAEKIAELEEKLKKEKARQRAEQTKADAAVGRRLRESGERFRDITAHDLVTAIDPSESMTIVGLVEALSDSGFASRLAETKVNNDTDSVSGSTNRAHGTQDRV